VHVQLRHTLEFNRFHSRFEFLGLDAGLGTRFLRSPEACVAEAVPGGGA